MLAPNFISSILEAGASIELPDGYAPNFITDWIKIAVARGGHLILAGNYAPNFLIDWAKLGGSHFTYRVG